MDEFIGRLNINAISPMPIYCGQLYHYTSLKNVNSILANKTDKIVLWASRFDCLNDTSEGQIIKNVYKSTCDKLLNEKKITQGLYDVFVTVQPNKTNLFVDLEKSKFVRCEFDTYITSFSTGHDLLNMWNYYSKGNLYDGVNLGFNSENIKTSLVNNTPFSGIDVQICPVIYDESKQMEMIEDFLLHIQEKYKDSKDDTYVRYVIAHKLTEWSMIFKGSYFEYEKEVRVVIRVGKKIDEQISVQYRDGFGYIIPYIELEIEKQALTQVTLGPLSGGESQENTQKQIVKDMLEKYGYDAGVEISKIPIRY